MFCLAIFPFLLSAQLMEDYLIPSTFLNKSKIITVAENEDGIRCFLMQDQDVTSKNQPYVISVVEVFDYKSADDYQNPVKVGTHYLKNYKLPVKASFQSKAGVKTMTRSSELVDLADLKELYPELSEVKYIDNENRDLPEQYYTSELQYNAWKGKITGWKMMRYERNKDGAAKPQARKGRGLLAKAVDLANNLEGRETFYVDVEKVAHDWEDDYNGGQDKKNFWFNFHSAGCPSTGKVVAVTGKKMKDVKVNHLMEGEVVLFDPQGEVIKRDATSSAIPWDIALKGAHYNLADDNNRKLEYITTVSKQAKDKELNPEVNHNQIKVKSISADGEVLYDYTYEIPLSNKSRLDTVMTNKDGRVVVYGVANKGKNQFLLESTPTDQKMTIFSLKSASAFDIHDHFEHKGDTYLVFTDEDFKTKIPKYYSVYKISDGKEIEPTVMKLENDDRTGAGLEVLINDNEQLILVTKESAKGIMDFKFELGMPQFYKLEGDKFVEMSDFEKDTRCINASSVASKMTSVKTAAGNYYFLSKNFVPDPKKKGKYLVQNRLTRLSF